MDNSRGAPIPANRVTAGRQSRALGVASMMPLDTAEELRQALEEHGIKADVHDGYGLALVSVWVGLVVWSDGERFWWRTGWDARRRRFVYAWHPALDPRRAARRIAFRYANLRGNGSLPELIAESMS
ncbi:hypothetical protein SAMN05216275_105199 [Streptosporangium canum]|uniref:Uncharacterized protein n=1 Tax=Streptosporangium canum TaxID=324952 RepID=A0A1I3LMQ3_9ACTN|nr:hypothetical protein [Streptosporangium canum]SFI85765.1 hypothetical protein SAMN05216275_105199 [Streptosporangium canum]